MGCLKPVVGQVSLVAGVMGKVPGAASVSTITDVRDVNLMPNIDVVTPVSSAPTDRLALGVGPVRPGVAGIGGTLKPSYLPSWISH